MTPVPACVSVRLRELREDRAPLQPHSPVCLRHRGLPPYLCVRGGGPQDGGEPTSNRHLCLLHQQKKVNSKTGEMWRCCQSNNGLFILGGGGTGGNLGARMCSVHFSNQGIFTRHIFFKFRLLKFHLQAYHEPEHLEKYILETCERAGWNRMCGGLL